jgi:threonine/homoserine/homoserine lactone efflux protein
LAVSSVLAFWAVAFLLIIVPGADWAFTIGVGLGGRSVVPAVSGLVVGYLMMTVVVAAGVGAFVAGHHAALDILTIVGGLYLMWHGATTFFKPSSPESPGQAVPRSTWATVGKGAGVSGLNPKGLLLFLALLPQFTNPRWAWPVAGQIGVLGLVFVVTCGAFYLFIGSFAKAVLHRRTGAARVVSRLSGASMFVIGTALVVGRLIG